MRHTASDPRGTAPRAILPARGPGRRPTREPTHLHSRGQTHVLTGHRPPRIALYSPGMVGLGHLRRNLLLARRFSLHWPDAAILMLTEAREAGTFEFPETVDCFSLPAIRKGADGAYRPRRLGVDLDELVRMRSAVLDAALSGFDPDVLIVDHLPRGALGELGPSLERLHQAGRTAVVLGMRDILDSVPNVQVDWARGAHARTIERHFDHIWIYGDPDVFDPLSEYALPACVSARARFTGYLDPFEHARPHQAQGTDALATRMFDGERMILCQVGGGQDGAALASAFVESDLPADAAGVLVTGPFMPADERERLANRASRHGGRMTVLALVTEPAELLVSAERVITMGGYNSTCELVAARKHALVVPRTRPRAEQLIRATRFAERCMLDMLDPDRLTPAALSAWMAAPAPARPAPPVDMNGLTRASLHLEELLADLASRRPGRHSGLRRSSSA